MFTDEQNAVFIGERNFKLALVEPYQSSKKRELIELGVKALAKNWKIVNLDTVVPLLIKNGNLVATMHVCVMKARSVQND